MQRHQPLTQLSEDDLEWIAGFEQRLRDLEPAYGADGAGSRLDDVTRSALEGAPELRALEPAQAAERWIEAHPGGARFKAC